MNFLVAALAAASLLGAILAAPAIAAEEDAVDCSSTPFSFSGQGYYIDCLRYEADARKDGASGQSQSDVINVTSDERSMFLTLVSIRLTSTGLHMRYQTLRENTRDFFGGVEFKDWNGIGYKNGYDTAEFTSDISGQPSHCIAVQRYLNPAYGGFKRHVIGMGCAAGSLDPVYSALRKVRAPGD
jgi:opacity protein-like surface antigen